MVVLQDHPISDSTDQDGWGFAMSQDYFFQKAEKDVFRHDVYKT